MKRLAIIALSCVVLMSSGCWTARGVFAPRSGEIFQTTRMGPGPAGLVPAMVFGWSSLAASRGHTDGVVVAILSFPFLALTPPIVLADECIVSPAVDLVCLPYDLFQPNHGFYIRIVDEDGNPLSDVWLDGRTMLNNDFYPMAGSEFTGKTDEKGEFYVGKLLDCKCSFKAAKEDYQFWLYNKSFRPEPDKPDPDGRLVYTYTLKRGDLRYAPVNAPSREAVASLVVGRWSADKPSREVLASEYEYTNAFDPAEHVIELNADGTCVARTTTDRYEWGSCFKKENYESGCSLSKWSVQAKAELDYDYYSYREPKGWLWRVRLEAEPKGEQRGVRRMSFYLGCDEQGPYLAAETENPDELSIPRLWSDVLNASKVIKFRKVAND